MQSTNTDIAARAYQLWEEEGRPHGKDLEHWERAAAELSSNGTNGAATAPKAKAAAAKKAPVAVEAPVAPVAKPKKTTAKTKK